MMKTAEASFRLKGNYFGEPDFFRTDVTKGVTRTPAGVRVCALPSDFLLGLRDAVIYECGRSYRPVLKAAGRRWGGQFIKRLDRELTAFYQTPFKDLPAGLIGVCLADAFAAHGYGRLTVAPLEDAPELRVAVLTDSVMPALVRESDRPVDLLMTGLLAASFSHLTGRTLDAVQTECTTMGAEQCRFLIGPTAAIAEVESWLDAAPSHPPHDEIVRRAVAASRPAMAHPAERNGAAVASPNGAEPASRDTPVEAVP